MRTPVIAGNWKMFKNESEAAALIEALAPAVQNTKGVEIVVAPVFTSIAAVREKIRGTNINLAAQNCFWENEGAFTGEISAPMLVTSGCTHVIIGHSERRQFFGETDETVNKKIKAAIAVGLTVLFCIGETLAEREGELTFDVLSRQVKEGLAGIDSKNLDKIVIAYEPVWAIGTGKTASDDQAQDAHSYIRGLIAGLYSQDASENIRILYGGSVKPENVKGLMSQEDIDGALVGGASLKAESFAAIVNFNS